MNIDSKFEKRIIFSNNNVKFFSQSINKQTMNQSKSESNTGNTEEEIIKKNSSTLVVFDLDHTILDLNTDTELIKILAEKCPDKISKVKDQNNWATYMNDVMDVMHEEGYDVPEIKNIIENLEYNIGFKDLFSFIEQNKNRFEVVIFSGCNTIFVDWIIRKKKLDNIIVEYHSNLAEISKDGKIKIRSTHLHECKECDLSQCKQKLLKDYVSRRDAQNIKFKNVVFVGDGKNDFCLTKVLSKNDLVCYRIGYKLEEKIAKWKKDNFVEEVEYQSLPWNTGFEIIEKLKILV